MKTHTFSDSLLSRAACTLAACLALGTFTANAATIFDTAGSIYTAGNWSNGLPGTGNDGTIAISGGSIPDGVPIFASGTYSITSSADIATVDEFNLRISAGGSLTWNMTDGTITTRYFLSNGGEGNVTFNMSGGQLVVKSGGVYIGAGNGGDLNISGSAELDASNASSDPLLTGSSTINFLSGWTGFWTQGTYTGTDWRDEFVAGTFSYNGSTISGATFDSTFQVSDAGQTLTLIPPPAHSTLSPADGATVPTTNTLTMTFDKEITTNTTGSITITNLAGGAAQVIPIGDTSRVAVSTTNLTITPSPALAGDASYAVLIDTKAIKDLAGNFFAGFTNTVDWDWNFSLVDPGPPISTTAGGATNIGVGAATLRGLITEDWDETLDDVRIYFGDEDGGEDTDGWDTNYVFTGSVTEGVTFSTNLTGLLYGAPYNYRVYASNTYGAAWSSVTNFTTTAPSGTGGAVTKTQVDISTFSSQYPVYAFDVQNPDSVLVVGIYSDGTTVSNIRFGDGGGIGSGDVAADAVSSSGRGYLAYFLNPSTDSGQAIRFDKSGANGSIVTVWELAGVDLAATVNTGQNTITTDAAGDFIVSIGYGNGDAAARPSASSVLSLDTNQDSVSGGGHLSGGSATAASAGSQDTSWDTDSDGSPLTLAFVPLPPSAVLSISNTTAENVTAVAADLEGSLDTTQSVFTVLAYWSTNNHATLTDWQTDGTASNQVVGTYTNVTGQPLTASVSNLLSGTTYYYTYVATNAATNIWAGSNVEFETGLGAGQIGIANLAADNVLDDSARLNATLETPGTDADVIAYWWITGDSTTNEAAVDSWNDVASTNISYTVPGSLQPLTDYTFTFRATNATQDVWAETPLIFSTIGAPVVTNETPAVPQDTTATLYGTVTTFNDTALQAVKIFVGESDGGTSTSGWDTNFVVSLGSVTEGVEFSLVASNLLAETQYSYRVYASNSVDEGWSQEEQFTTWPALSASGGSTINFYTDAGGTSWFAHVFADVGSDTFAPTLPLNVEYLIVAGGGGGGGRYYSRSGGGGGAGGLLSGSTTLAAADYAVTVGACGNRGSSTSNGGDGGDSSINGIATATGGGGGGYNGANGRNGGSGGGGSGHSGTTSGGTGVAGPPRQGYDGGGCDNSTRGQAGGGGGAGGPGADASAGSGGGPGVSFSITGTPVTYAAGGDGGILVEGAGPGASAADNTGDGGEGGYSNDIVSNAGYGGYGGSGIVVIRYLAFGDTTGPQVEALAPTNNAAGVLVSTNLVATFDEAIATNTTGSIVITNLSDNTLTTTIAIGDTNQVTVTGTSLTVNPSNNLAFGKMYAVLIDTNALTDLVGNFYAGITNTTTWRFTAEPPDLTPPVITDRDPTPGATGVFRGSTITATFDDTLLVESGDIILYDVALGAAAQTIAVTDGSQVSVAGSVLTITPASTLDLNTEYAVRIAAGAVENRSNVGFEGLTDNSWNFTTEDAPTYTWIQGGVDATQWDDTDNWQGGFVPPQAEAGTELVFSGSTSGNVGGTGNKVTFGSISWESGFSLYDFGSYGSPQTTGLFVDTGTSDPATATLANNATMTAYYVPWNLDSDLVLSGSGRLIVQAAKDDGVNGPGGFVVGSGTEIQFDATHLSHDYSYTGGVTIRNGGLVDVDSNNGALGNGLLTMEEGGRLQAHNSALDNDVSIVLTSNGDNPASNTPLISGGGASLVFSGEFTFDVSGVTPAGGNRWQIVNATASYGPAFSVAGFTESDGIWSAILNGVEYRYNENTGILSIPPGTIFMFR